MTEYVRQGNPNWYKGQPSANPNGRPRSRVDSKKVRKVREEALVAVAEHVAETPTEPRSAIQILRDFANDASIPHSLRISAASGVAPYEAPRLMSVPAPVFIYTPIEVPDFNSIEAAESFLLQLSQREGIQELESQSVAAISGRVRDWIQSKRQGQELEIKRAAQGDLTGDQIIHIEGGLPPLPGTNITMPNFNGNSADGLLANEAAHPQTIEHSPEPSKIESIPAPPAQDSEP